MRIYISLQQCLAYNNYRYWSTEIENGMNIKTVSHHEDHTKSTCLCFHSLTNGPTSKLEKCSTRNELIPYFSKFTWLAIIKIICMNNTAHNYVISMSNSECFSIYSQMTAHDVTMDFLYLHSSYQTSITFGRINKIMFMTTIFLCLF